MKMAAKLAKCDKKGEKSPYFLRMSMHSLIVLPGITSKGSWGNKYNNNHYIFVDPKDFTFDWCIRHIPGCEFDNVQIWASNDVSATAYVLSRAFGLIRHTGGFLMTNSVWRDLEKMLQEDNLDQEDINRLKLECNIVEDL